MPRIKNESLRKQKRATTKQIFQLYKELEKRGAEFQEKRPSFTVAMQELSDALGFIVTAQSFTTAREATGINWKPKLKKEDRPVRVPKEMLATSPRITLGEFLGMKANIEKLQNDFSQMQEQFLKQKEFIAQIFEEFELSKPQPKPEEVNHPQ